MKKRLIAIFTTVTLVFGMTSIAYAKNDVSQGCVDKTIVEETDSDIQNEKTDYGESVRIAFKEKKDTWEVSNSIFESNSIKVYKDNQYDEIYKSKNNDYCYSGWTEVVKGKIHNKVINYTFNTFTWPSDWPKMA